MSAEASLIYLLDNGKQALVEAQLWDAIEDRHVLDWQTTWQPAVTEICTELHKLGIPRTQWPQSAHWNWRNKLDRREGLLAFESFAVTREDSTQGLMLVKLIASARIPSEEGKPLVYVEFLEVAPWNWTVQELGRSPLYKGVGKALVAAAVQLSEDEGFKGRVGLHSLPQSVPFYRNHCSMTELGPDSEYEGLPYFEMTPDQAQAFLEKK